MCENRFAGCEKDMATQTFELPQFGSIKRRANAETAYRAVITGLTTCLACHEGNLHAPLQTGGCDQIMAGLRVDRILADRLDAR